MQGDGVAVLSLASYESGIAERKAAKLRFNALKRGSKQRSCGSFSDKLRKRQSRAQCPSDVQCAEARGRPEGV